MTRTICCWKIQRAIEYINTLTEVVFPAAASGHSLGALLLEPPEDDPLFGSPFSERGLRETNFGIALLWAVER